MRVRHNAESGSEAQEGRKFPDRPAIAALASSSAERLDYIAAMVQELRMMSAQANCPRLAGLLDLAYREAVQRRRRSQ
jgi:hypothetical protein